MLNKIVRKNRSYRRFYEDVKIKLSFLRCLVKTASFCPSALNAQPLRFIISNTKNLNNIIFHTLKWAGYLKDWPGPEQGERPSAYIIILADTKASTWCAYDCAIAAQTILLSAVEQGFGGCMFGSINRENLRKQLNISSCYEILLVVALGKPKEKVKTEKIKAGNIKYYRDKKQVHHVPKRELKEILIHPDIRK